MRKKEKRGSFEKELREAEGRGLRVLPPGEREPTHTESNSSRIIQKYGSVDALPLEYARRALRELKLSETPDYLNFVWAYLKDRMEQSLNLTAKKYHRLRLERTNRNEECYQNFYNALSPYVSDLPLPREGNVLKFTPKKAVR